MKRYLSIKWTAFTCILLAVSFLWGCKEDIGITVNKIGEKPQPISNAQVTPIAGGAYIKYDLPLSEDLRYVLATYKLDNGVEREAKASIYKNEILVDGFGKEGEYNIELKAVAVGEVQSDPVTVKVKVLTPPYQLVLNKLKSGNNIEAAFGGINLRYVNELKSDIIIRVLRKDSTGKWQNIQNEYTSFERGVVRVRGLPAGPADFGVFIEDRWDHFTDTLLVNLSPIEEVLIPTDKWKHFELDNDAESRGGQWNQAKIWDGNTGIGNLTKASPLPVPIVTIDLGVPVLLSRLVRYTNNSGGGLYGSAHIFDFAVYGSNNPDPSGDWASWTLLDRFEGFRASGNGFGVGASSEEKADLLKNGETHEFSDPTAHEKFRYIRIRVYATWNGFYEGDVDIYLNELLLYGQL